MNLDQSMLNLELMQLNTMSLIDQLAEQRRKKIDDAFWSAMEHHGYSKEWCLHPDNRKRIEVIAFGRQSFCMSEIIRVRLDNIELFTMKVSLHEDFEEMKLNFIVEIAHSAQQITPQGVE